MNLSNLSDEELINLYPSLLDELKNRKIIRTKNIIGEIGEYFVKQTYNKNPKLPKLQLGIKSTKNVDANSSDGERYAIKTTSTKNTGVFHSIPVNDDGKVHFEYLVVVMFDSDYQLQSIYELSWDMFLKFRKIKRPENKYFMGMNKSVLDYAKKIL